MLSAKKGQFETARVSARPRSRFGKNAEHLLEVTRTNLFGEERVPVNGQETVVTLMNLPTRGDADCQTHVKKAAPVLRFPHKLFCSINNLRYD